MNPVGVENDEYREFGGGTNGKKLIVDRQTGGWGITSRAD
jgi:hypothetical protein